MSLMASLCVLIMGATYCKAPGVSYSRCTSQSHGVGDFLDRERRRQPPLGDGGFERRQARLEAWVALEPRDQPLVEHGPQPFDLLLLAPRRKFPGVREAVAMGEHLLPQRGETVAGERRIGDDRRAPVGRAGGEDV